MIDIKQLDAATTDFWLQLETLLAWEGVSDDAVTSIVETVEAEDVAGTLYHSKLA